MAEEALARRTIFASFRTAARELFGPAGMSDIAARMSPEARAVCIEAVTIPAEMLPERFVIEWYTAAWEGPAGRDREKYHRFLDRMMDHGFGRVRKFLLGVASPTLVLRKAPDLWRHDHTTGTLSMDALDNHHGIIRLVDHAYIETPISRDSIAEIYRYAVSLSRVSTVRSTHHLLDERTLRVHLDWQ